MKRWKSGVCWLAVSMMVMPAAHAFLMDTTTVEITAKATKVIQRVSNPDNSSHMMTVSVQRIENPYTMAHVEEDVPGELLFTPASAMIKGKNDQVVTFYYHGPEDDKERYYKVTWRDEALVMEDEASEDIKSATVAASALVSTVLMVHPRKENFAYALAGNSLENKGNSSFRFVAYGPCLEGAGTAENAVCNETRYMQPGRTRAFDQVDIADAKSKLGIWRGQKLISVK